MHSRGDRSQELGAFLKGRRAALDPAAVGLADAGQTRRVPGLRREEVAHLAMISTDYLTRLEQGRLSGASPAVLDALATALQLSEDERSYLFQVADKNDHRPQHEEPSESVSPQLRQLLDNLGESPAIVLGRSLDILAWNRLATVIFRDFAQVPRHERNFLRMIFLDPQVRDRYADWPPIARMCVGFVRGAADGAAEPHLAAILAELSLQDADFRAWWTEQHPNYQAAGTKTLTHPDVGPYTLDWQVLRTFDDQLLMAMTAPPDSDSLYVLRKLDAQNTPDSSDT